ncbi:ataxin 1 [Rhynchophorus ferrugineus]|uniref:ataxin 1 n=1 Tax=Rhynchophorus ferrugineus TaxID=354439 RepID=UPI003FCCD3B8
MISAGVEGRMPYMTYSEQWSRNPSKPPHEVFLRPAPKLLPPTAASRCTEEPVPFIHYRSYNGSGSAATFPNGTRIAPTRPLGKYMSSPPSTSLPVNLTQPKEECNDTIAPFSPLRLFPHSPQYTSYPYPGLCPQPYIIRGTPPFPPTPLSPQETFSPGTPTASTTATFMSPSATFSPPSTIVKPPYSMNAIRDKRTPPLTPTSLPASPGFKVPSGKEGSMKHRLLIRPEDGPRNAPLDLQKPPEGRKRLAAAASPPRSPKRALNNNAVPANFQKGQLIQLASGEFKRIEDMRTEDFIQSAEETPALRLAESTVLKIEDRREGHVTITLTYDKRRAQVEVDTTPEHPYFVMGHGWASFNPEKTQQCYGLKVHKLQVGDVLVSLTPRETPSTTSTAMSTSNRGTTIMTTATTTTMSTRQYSINTSSSTSISNSSALYNPPASNAQPMSLSNHRPLSHSPPKSIRSQDYALAVSQGMHFYGPAISAESKVAPQTTPLPLDVDSRKRRWSAPDAIDEEERAQRNRVVDVVSFDGTKE